MYREAAVSSEVHISHTMSRRFCLKRDERTWDRLDDLGLASKIEMRYNDIKGVQ
jgi:hypothetical protein